MPDSLENIYALLYGSSLEADLQWLREGSGKSKHIKEKQSNLNTVEIEHKNYIKLRTDLFI